MTIKIIFFAGLKRFFDGPITLEANLGDTALDVIDQLKKKKPEAADLLSHCRLAINEEFVELTTKIEDHMELFLIPPSSGG